MVYNHRTSDMMKLNDCRADASLDPVFEFKCFESYIKNTLASNDSMKKQFAAENSKYM